MPFVRFKSPTPGRRSPELCILEHSLILSPDLGYAAIGFAGDVFDIQAHHCRIPGKGFQIRFERLSLEFGRVFPRQQAKARLALVLGIDDVRGAERHGAFVCHRQVIFPQTRIGHGGKADRLSCTRLSSFCPSAAQ